MLQFYLLSVLLNLLTGLVLFFSFDHGEVTDGFETDGITRIDDPSLFENPTLRLVLGGADVVVGILKLFVVTGGIRVFGDLLPVLGCLTGGIVLLINYVTTKSSLGLKVTGLPHRLFVEHPRYIGIGCMVVAVLHFVFPKILFL
jgi:hypothetical protein